MNKVSNTSGKTPTPLPSQSAWAKGPPQSSSSATPSPRSQSPAPTHVASPIATSHSRRPSALGQGVSVKDGVSVPRNNVGSVVRPASVVFGSIDDASAPLSSSPAAIPAVKTEVVKSFGSVPATSSNHVNGKISASASATGSSKQPPRPTLSNSSTLSSTAATLTASTPKPSRADITKLFQNPSSSSSQPSSDTSSPSTRPSNLPSHHQPSSSSSQQPQPQQPSQLGTHSYSQFVPNNMRQPQQPSGTPRSPAFPRAVPNVQGPSRQGAGPGGPGGPPIPASPRMAPHPHQAPPGGIGQQVPMQPMSWPGYYYMDPYQPQPPWGYYAVPSPHMHQQPPQHVPHVPPHQPGPLPMSPRPAAPQLPGTPTMAHAIPHPPHTPQPPPSISSPPPTPSTTNAPRLNTNARDFVPGGRPTSKVTIKSQDGMEVTLDALKKHSPQPPTVPIPPASPVVTNRRQPSVSVRIESEESKRAREEIARKEQEKKDEEERAKKDAIEKKKREAEEEAKRIEEEEAARKRKAEEERIRMEEEEKERIRQAEEAENERLRQEEEDRLEAEQQEAEQARIALEDEERKQQDALEAEEAQLEAEEAADIVQTSSPTSESQEPEDGEVSEHDEALVPQLNGDSGKKLKESLRIDTSAMPPPTEIPRRRPGPLDLASTTKKDISAPPPSALLTARVIENLSEVAYPEGIKSPKVELNANVRDGRFRYDRDFLMQFMHICKEKPPTLPALDVLGIEPVDQASFPMARGGSGRHRNASGAMPVSANRQASVGLGIGGFQKPSVPSGFQMGNFQSPGSKLTSEERFAMSNRSASTSSATSQFRSPMVRTPSTGGPGHPMHGSNRIRSKRGEKRGDANKTPMSQQEHGSGYGVAPILGAGFEPVAPLELSANRWVPNSTARKGQSDVDSPELVDRKVKALLNKLTMEKFETISDQIIHWANKSVNEKDGRTLIQVIRLVFEKATDEAAWSEMYARLCRKMMEQISPEVQDDGIKNTEGKPIAGGQLFRKYLLNRCQEDFERGWFAKEATAAAAAAKASDDHATKTANDKKSTEEAELYSEEYYAAQKAKRQGLGLIKFIGELFKLQMLTERIMHECVKKLLGNVENPEEEEIESLCQLLKTVGQLLDTPKARAHMDVYFTRMKELGKSLNVSSRMQFMLQDVIELRDRKWVSRNAVAAPTTIAAVHELAAKEKAAAEKESFNRQISMSRGGSRRGDNRNQEHGPDGWAVAGGSSVPRAPPKAGDLSQFGKISKGPAMGMVMGPSGIFAAGKKDSKRETLSRTNSSSNMFHMLSQNPELAPEASTKPSRSSSRKTSVDLGHAGVPEPAVQRRRLQLLPRSVHTTEENATTPSEEEPESAPMAMSAADVKKKIDEDVKEFFAVRNLQEAEVYFANLPDEHRFRLVDKLVASALESKEADARLVGDFFAQATSNGQCTLEVIEEGFMPMAEFLDDIAIDAPKAFDYMAIMLKGAGFENEPERLQRIASKLEDSDKLVSLVA
ncbi:uncharacterized protein HD556DRAFT_1263252 [Suillus plorans]|uniref:MI domain-containing protein n=1 Tax=Suillus plorans TaxID=116603 RepID=A0A9P7DU18_9AGAM|nr:uncharacterized protein HD556DRAFT_1263252 [Suillus plorans]KAG1802921.1 hypothetical protein HD556DRAFT_1263252 [Suillus plorans]